MLFDGQRTASAVLINAVPGKDAPGAVVERTVALMSRLAIGDTAGDKNKCLPRYPSYEGPKLLDMGGKVFVYYH